MRVKICGITSPEEASMCEDMGADAIGLVRFPMKRRSLGLETIAEIVDSSGPFITKILICRPESLLDTFRMLDRSGADGVQLYSLEPDEMEQIRECGYRVIRSVPPIAEIASRYGGCSDALVFEGGEPGSGTSYDYSSIPLHLHPRSIIAGGLNLANIVEVRNLKPYGVDVSSGVEKDGKKDPNAVREFIRRCRS